MKYKHFFKALSALIGTICFLGSATAENQKPTPPNVVFIMADDVGYGDFGVNGSPVSKTPHIDHLANESIALTDYHTSPYCIPTRASLLTGRYADRSGIHNRLTPHWFLRTDQTLISTVFKKGGYATGLFGKWHLGDNHPYSPESRDFDEVLTFRGGAIATLADYWDNSYVDDTYFHNGKATKYRGFCTDIFFDAAKDFIDASTKANKPFFLYLPSNAAHGPYVAPPEFTDLYPDRANPDIKGFYAMVSNLDANVGKLRAFLDERGLSENTIFIFTSDNGTGPGGSIFNAGMRGTKGSPYDGGHRLPFFLYWPQAGYTQKMEIPTLTSTMDVMPTLLDLCGLDSKGCLPFDGASLKTLFENKTKDWPDRVIMTDSQYSGPPQKWHQTAVMTQRWRLIENRELYDINKDPGQAVNVYSDHPEVVRKLSQFYDDLWAEFVPEFEKIARIPLGDARAPSSQVLLNYHDSVGRHMFWYQDGIRQARPTASRAENAHPYWPVDVKTDGFYRFELRRWPAELDIPIYANLAPGELVYGKKSIRTVPGIGYTATQATLKIGGKSYKTSVSENDKFVSFTVDLKAGETNISGYFSNIPKNNQLDAFYIYVIPLDQKTPAQE